MTLHNQDAERALLASLLAGVKPDLLDDVSALVRGRDFYQPKHEALWDAIMAVHATGDRVDPVTLPVPPAAREFVMELLAGGSGVLHAPQVLRYAETVLDCALRRRVSEAATGLHQLAEQAEDTATMAQDAERIVADATSQVRTSEGGTTLGDGLDDALEWLEHAPTGAPTPWPDVNDKTNGLLAGQMITVAARPGHGKSLALKDVAVFTAQQGIPVHIATMEMSRHEYVARIIAAMANVDLGRMLRRQLSEGDWGAIALAQGKLRDLPLYLDDRENQSMAQIRAAARQTKRRYGTLGLVGIDYAQLVRPEDRRLPREQQVAQISRDTKLLAKELECPVMLLAQLNRGNTQRADHTPLVSDLRESGALEQDSDQVWLLHRPDQYGDERLGEVDLIVGKNRNGPAPSVIPLAFQGHYARMASLV